MTDGVSAISRTLAAAVALAERAGALLLAMQRGELETRAKSDGSPVTRADRAAHDVLVGGLPGVAAVPVISEESEGAAGDWCAERCVWIVDPLDGTRDYLRGSAHFTVNVALVDAGVPVLGVVVAPALGLTYFAERGAGAYRRGAGGRPEPITCRRELASGDRIVVSGSDVDRPWSTVPHIAGVQIEAVSSAVKLGFVADGRAIAYPRLTLSSEWDIAAGHAVLIEAGGRVVDCRGRDLRYNKRDPLNPPFVASGSPQTIAAFATLLAPA